MLIATCITRMPHSACGSSSTNPLERSESGKSRRRTRGRHLPAHSVYDLRPLSACCWWSKNRKTGSLTTRRISLSMICLPKNPQRKVFIHGGESMSNKAVFLLRRACGIAHPGIYCFRVRIARDRGMSPPIAIPAPESALRPLSQSRCPVSNRSPGNCRVLSPDHWSRQRIYNSSIGHGPSWLCHNHLAWRSYARDCSIGCTRCRSLVPE